MQHTTTIPLILALSIVTACGGDECLPTINADTLIAPVDPICVTTDALSTGGEDRHLAKLEAAAERSGDRTAIYQYKRAQAARAAAR